MGFLSSFTGSSQAKAAKGAAMLQSQGVKEAQTELRKGERVARMDLRDFRELGRDSIDGLSSLVTDPNAQRDFIQNNPFFDALAQRSTDTLLNNQAARGKVGSGGTAEALQNSMMLLGNDLLSQNIAQRQGLVNTGLNAAGGMANITQNTRAGIADLRLQNANAQAAGVVGAANARGQGMSNLVGLGTSIAGLGLPGGGTVGGSMLGKAFNI